MIYKLDALKILQRVMPNKDFPSAAYQIRHIVSIFSLPFDDTNLLHFNERFMIRYEGDKYRIVKSTMPMIKRPINMMGFIMDCNRYGIELSLKVSDEKESSLYRFLYEEDDD